MIEVFNGANPGSVVRAARDVDSTHTGLFASERAVCERYGSRVRIARREGSRRGSTCGRLFQLAYGREPDAQERRVAFSALVAKTLDLQTPGTRLRRNLPKKPLVHMITSELTGERVEFRQQEDPSESKIMFIRAMSSSETRALAAFALALFNSNEFVYVY